mmetsp:Transcript_12125/g.35704  ORF Transcript_12125/g.35704 Transcript_12125/m.35704 type:complete len:96 (+) Transcript_12125:230-517(+)
MLGGGVQATNAATGAVIGTYAPPPPPSPPLPPPSPPAPPPAPPCSIDGDRFTFTGDPDSYTSPPHRARASSAGAPLHALCLGVPHALWQLVGSAD